MVENVVNNLFSDYTFEPPENNICYKNNYKLLPEVKSGFRNEVATISEEILPEKFIGFKLKFRPLKEISGFAASIFSGSDSMPRRNH
jgi:hypothetical protein